LQAPAAACVAQAAALCNRTADCEAFGVYGSEIQLHGCTNTVPNHDWTIYVRDAPAAPSRQPAAHSSSSSSSSAPPPAPGYRALAAAVNIDEEKCSKHPHPNTAQCAPPPPPPAPPQHYDVLGSLDVFTMENTQFYWKGSMYLLENIGCHYWGHAGAWQPEVFGNHSYARVRELATGRVVANVR